MTQTVQPRQEELLVDGALTIAAAVREFGISRSALYRLMDEGTLPYCRPHGRRLIPRRALRNLLAETLTSK